MSVKIKIMDSASQILISDLLKYKRSISFYTSEFIRVCSGINFEAKCSNPDCKAARNLSGLVIIRYPGVTSCNYHELVPYLSCPFCCSDLAPERVKGIVFVRCKAKISVGGESVEFRAGGEDTFLWELPSKGAEIHILILEKDPGPETVPKR